MDFLKKLEEIESAFQDIESRMADPEISNNVQEMQSLSRRHSELYPVVQAFREYRKVMRSLEEAQELLEQDDEEMRQLAKEEVQRLSDMLPGLEQDLKVLLLPRDPNDHKNVIIEIRAGAGGDEAALFAADLFRMYTRYTERQGWRYEIMEMNETGIGGYKEVVFLVKGEGAYSKLKFESGVHRVQRIPVTEASGRIHTSTATVAVLPEAEDVDVQIRPEDLKIDTYRASGAGGQYVNMTDSAVRITHIPTGLVVTCQDERSQLKNRAKAMQLLRARLYDQELQKQQAQMAAERKGQVGTGDRSERIRTYNYPQNRLTDHRIGFTLYKLDQVLDGDLYELIEALRVADQAEKLKTLAL
ncbi:peptide chain release factor 1 [Thermanaerovibrio acidaminovorans DSM 6589]|uniref:Peptide chain release factor 1 n=1 Tax=Thermanaerovibrio acidaminovorans (strain ATCC 49978 / DSM 6589 / Su883) TaxID=525903 RepID=D1B9V1_THEAS|nr:peptide chain release factor 1 [Thermanaerovibrio acidaminovorans]ACZ19054.1 peptide chain release factor 1 [Thermanaerovibrio acidaminovorans DSM 6589]